MMTHINHEMLTRQYVTRGPDHPVPPINFNQLEKQFIKTQKGYEMYTTSKLLKTMDIEGKDLDQFKQRFWKWLWEKPKHGTSRDKDVVEYLLEKKQIWEKKQTAKYLESNMQKNVSQLQLQEFELALLNKEPKVLPYSAWREWSSTQKHLNLGSANTKELEDANLEVAQTLEKLEFLEEF